MTLRAFRGTLFFLLFTASSALAQNSGTIVGNVHDTSGAQIEGATITVTNVEKGTSQTAVSGSDGEYVVPFLPTGTYRVSVEKPGFQRQDSPPTTLRSRDRSEATTPVPWLCSSIYRPSEGLRPAHGTTSLAAMTKQL